MTDDKHHIEITNPELIKRFVEGAMLQNLGNPERMLLKTLGDLGVAQQQRDDYREALEEASHWIVDETGSDEVKQRIKQLLASNEEKKDD